MAKGKTTKILEKFLKSRKALKRQNISTKDAKAVIKSEIIEQNARAKERIKQNLEKYRKKKSIFSKIKNFIFGKNK